jgi:hypothetical protein
MSKDLPTLTIVKVLSTYRVVINGGSQDGITEKDRFLIYELGEELVDPATKENLGQLEIVKGTGRPIHIQERLTTIESNKTRQEGGKRRIVTKSGGQSVFQVMPTTPTVEEIVEPSGTTLEPFSDAKVGDRAKTIH